MSDPGKPRSAGMFQPRVSAQPRPIMEDLARRGHRVARRQSALGGAQAILMDGDLLIGGSDPRKDGCALGY